MTQEMDRKDADKVIEKTRLAAEKAKAEEIVRGRSR